ncbi:MAG: tRNA-dihydrouridine synthase family protein [Muribaculaceae bacterium]|nr:tRNA-dihydrouridine synthase family protein [Muribaculaceae bacterium]
MTDSDFKIMAAPLQGFTEAPYRHLHSTLARGTADGIEYSTPFMRFERGEVRRRDMADLTSPLNIGVNLTPQIIFRDEDEFDSLVKAVRGAGCNRIDLNLGCPFPPQVRKGRGAGLLRRPDVMERIAERIISLRDVVEFSAKMRLGVEDNREWRGIVGILNSVPLRHVTIHPRTATQQYGGAISEDEFARLSGSLSHKVIYNGDITTPDEIEPIRARFTNLGGVMIGRGLLRRPSLVSEWIDGEEWNETEIRALVLRLHRGLLEHYSNILCGDSQILAKVRPWAEWMEPYVDHKTVKRLAKTGSLANYRSLIS